MSRSLMLKSLVVAATLSMSASAFAQSDPEPTNVVVESPDSECSVDADCAEGELCEIVDIGVCEACAPGEDCDSGCTSESFGMCVPPPPPPCGSDADCDANEVCVTYTFESCSGGAETPPCLPDEPCERPEPVTEECVSSSESLCVPRYVAPCQVDADCGAGFTCEASEICGCSVSGGTVDPEPGSDPDGEGDDEPVLMPDEDCSCEPSGENYCQLIPVECTSDAECEAGLTCESGPSMDTATPCYVDENGDTNCDTQPDPEPATSYCAPEDFYYWGGSDDSAARVAEASGNESAEVTATDRIDWGGDGAGTKSSTDDGCSATGAGNGGTLALLIGLAGMVLRRRR